MGQVSMKKILVIEDTAAIRKQLLLVLKLRGYDALGAESGLDGLKLVHEWHPDLVVCDIMLPELDGYEVLTQIRQDPQTAATPLIFLTAKSSKLDQRQGMELGADDYLTKPFTTEELLSAVRTRLERFATLLGSAPPGAAASKPAAAAASPEIDALTGLPTAAALYPCLRDAVAIHRPGRRIALLALGIDRFRRILEALGPASGDALIVASVGRLRDCLRSGDLLFRVGEEELVALLPGLRHRSEAAEAARRILDTLKLPIALQGHNLHLTASVGITLYPEDGELELVQQAEVALQAAREHGGNGIQFFRQGLAPVTLDTLVLEDGLQRAVERDELTLHYQPQLDLRTGQIEGVEALLRWRHPRLGLLPASRFIDVAEESGLIVPIGAWALRSACHQARAWQASGLRHVGMTVNLSPQQLREPDFPQLVERVLATSGLEPGLLTLELAESLLIQDPERVIECLLELKALGVSISVDDVGTGFSSVGYLKRFPIDMFKIDQTFVRDVALDRDHAARVIDPIAVAHGLGIEVIAEGVETHEQLLVLRTERCDGFQGAVFSMPVPAAALARMLAEDKRLDG